MDLYPAFLNLVGRKCLVVGSGRVALRRARYLARSGADVHLITPEMPQAPDARFQVHCRPFRISDLDDAWLVAAAANDPALNQRIAEACLERRLFCNIIDQRSECSFIVPSVIDRSPLLIAVTSGGTSPMLARVLKTKLESLIPSAYAKLAQVLGKYRTRVREKYPGAARRAQFWHNLINGPVGELGFSPDGNALENAIRNALSSIDCDEGTATGHVALVGSGPGDPDLLTFRALRLIQSADVIVFDRLVSKSILDMVRNNAELIYAGKARAEHTLAQPSINQLLVELAHQGKNVVRLKGGDPFIFGRGGEEIETLAEAGIDFQVVPGITAATGCAAFSGIPLTHRDHAQSCVFVTGNLRNGEINLNWRELQDPAQTIVVYMGLTGIGTICDSLIKYGRAADTPAALIEQGTTPSQRVIIGTLSTLAELVNAANIVAPTLLIIGSVVNLREKLNWFEPDTDAGSVFS